MCFEISTECEMNRQKKGGTAMKTALKTLAFITAGLVVGVVIGKRVERKYRVTVYRTPIDLTIKVPRSKEIVKIPFVDYLENTNEHKWAFYR